MRRATRNVAACARPELIHEQVIRPEGATKIFPMCGVKDSPPYMHAGRCLTLEDTVGFFNLVQQLRLTAKENSSSSRSRINCNNSSFISPPGWGVFFWIFTGEGICFCRNS